MARNFGTMHMVGQRDFEPQRNNNFELRINGLSNSDDIMLSVATYSAPQINISPITVGYMNNKIKFAGVPEFPESSITINDYIGLDIERILYKWYQLVYNPETELIGFASNYKKSAQLYEYAPNGSVCRVWDLKGVWPSSINLGEFSQEGGSVRQITMTLQYDYVIPSPDKSQDNEDPSTNLSAKIDG